MANSTQIWFLGACSAYLNFLCVRGAVRFAWAAMLGQIAVCGAWTASTGQELLTGVGFSFINLTPLLMATFFTWVVRPMAHSILALRQQDTDRAATEAAAQAAQQERDSRIARLDSTVRPLLEVVASGRPLTAAEQAECRLVEAELRDDIMGGVMIDAAVAAAARSARQRGVTVVLDDSGGLDEIATGLRQRVRTVVRDALDYADSGTVTARVLPPGRSTLASILLRDNIELRFEVDTTGTVRSNLDNRQFVRNTNQDPNSEG
jgi:signal transduction histidine kinase